MFTTPISPTERFARAVAEVVNASREIMTTGAIGSASDAEFIDMFGQGGDALRAIEAAVVTMSGEAATRSATAVVEDRLTTRLGCARVGELIENVTKVSGATAGRWMKIAEAIRPRHAFNGETLPARLPALAGAVTTGTMGVDAATVVVRALIPSRRTLDAEQVAAADEAIAYAARGAVAGAGDSDGDADSNSSETTAISRGDIACADIIKVHALAWAAAIDPDGAEPIEKAALRNRGLNIGVVRDGLAPLTGRLLPEVAEQLLRTFDSLITPRHTGGVKFHPTTDVGDSATALHGTECGSCPPDEGCRCAPPAIMDDRTADQKRHDAFATALFAAAASANLPVTGGAAPTLLVMVDEHDLTATDGTPRTAFLPLLGAVVPVDAAHHLHCAGDTQHVTMRDNGQITHISSPSRIFTAHQRRAIALRDGNCIIPGCSVPAGWAEIHHVQEHSAGGPTHTNNGVLLCWFHHRYLNQSGWQIRMLDGAPEVQAPHWLDPTGRWRTSTTSHLRITRNIKRRE